MSAMNKLKGPIKVKAKGKVQGKLFTPSPLDPKFPRTGEPDPKPPKEKVTRHKVQAGKVTPLLPSEVAQKVADQLTLPEGWDQVPENLEPDRPYFTQSPYTNTPDFYQRVQRLASMRAALKAQEAQVDRLKAEVLMAVEMAGFDKVQVGEVKLTHVAPGETRTLSKDKLVALGVHADILEAATTIGVRKGYLKVGD